MKKSYILVLIALIAIFSISAVSAGWFDGFGGGNVKFLDLSMTVDGANFEEGDSSAATDDYKISFYNISKGNDSRISALAKGLNKGSATKFDQKSISKAFKNADSSIQDTISFTYDKKGEARKFAKTILSFEEIKNYKDIDIEGHPAADFIVSDSIVYDESGSMIPSYMPDVEKGKTSSDLTRWVLVYDNNTSTLYGIKIESTKTPAVTDQSVLQSDAVQSMIDSISLK